MLDGDDESSDSGGDESFYVLEPLPQEFHSQDNLKKHIRDHVWTGAGQKLLGTLLRERLHLGDNKPFEDSKGYDFSDADRNAASIYLVHEDGAALQPVRPNSVHGHKATWDDMQAINNVSEHKKATGRIIVLREPPASLLAACHLVMQKHLDMDFVFRVLTDESPTKAYMRGCMKADTRHQRSFVFSFKYHTIVDTKRTPMSWQDADIQSENSNDHIAISTCSSVVALTLSGSPSDVLSQKSRKSKQIVGHVHDAFAPWQVLSIQCFPDWLSNTGTHEGNRHFVNGPEAFLITVLDEYRDAYTRFKALNRAIAKLVTPPKQFLFKPELREELLFESEDYMYSKRYFWAFQALAMLNDEIEAMIAQYQEVLTDAVWEGDHLFIWPGNRDKSARSANWRKRMGTLRKQFEKEIAKLGEVLAENKREQLDISFLREQLFSGTSVKESRQSVKLAEFTYAQGQNIRLLTLVSIFFLPLTFVTSVFGMTNMPPNDNFVRFGKKTP